MILQYTCTGFYTLIRRNCTKCGAHVIALDEFTDHLALPICPICAVHRPHLTTLDHTQWERVGAAIRTSPIHVGAIDCTKYFDLCRSFKVHSYPSLVGVNWPGAPEGTPEEPSVNLFKSGSHSFEDTMANIETAFPGMIEVGVPTREEEEGHLDLHGEAAKVGGEVWRTRVASCALRLEDAAVSVHWILRNDVFTQGLRLTDKRMGE